MSTAPSRKGSTSDAPVKQTSTVVAKSKETASKASGQDDAICPECELLVDEDSKAHMIYAANGSILGYSIPPARTSQTPHPGFSGLVTVAHQVGHPGPGSCCYQLLACCQEYWAVIHCLLSLVSQLALIASLAAS